MFEIERKFLLKDSINFEDAIKVEKITQGYMSTDKEKVIRVRIVEGLIRSDIIQGYITVKGIQTGSTRMEIESKIDYCAASNLLQHFCNGSKIIEKVRFTMKSNNLKWEVDYYRTNNEGLVTVEVELKSETQKIKIPSWVGEEITHDHRYSNSNLSINPWPFK